MEKRLKGVTSGKIDVLHLFYKYGIVFTLAVIVIVSTVTTGGTFISSNNILNIFRSMSITAVIALGITFSVAVMDLIYQLVQRFHSHQYL